MALGIYMGACSCVCSVGKTVARIDPVTGLSTWTAARASAGANSHRKDFCVTVDPANDCIITHGTVTTLDDPDDPTTDAGVGRIQYYEGLNSPTLKWTSQETGDIGRPIGGSIQSTNPNYQQPFMGNRPIVSGDGQSVWAVGQEGYCRLDANTGEELLRVNRTNSNSGYPVISAYVNTLSTFRMAPKFMSIAGSSDVLFFDSLSFGARVWRINESGQAVDKNGVVGGLPNSVGAFLGGTSNGPRFVMEMGESLEYIVYGGNSSGLVRYAKADFADILSVNQNNRATCVLQAFDNRNFIVADNPQGNQPASWTVDLELNWRYGVNGLFTPVPLNSLVQASYDSVSDSAFYFRNNSGVYAQDISFGDIIWGPVQVQPGTLTRKVNAGGVLVCQRQTAVGPFSPPLASGAAVETGLKRIGEAQGEDVWPLDDLAAYPWTNNENHIWQLYRGIWPDNVGRGFMLIDYVVTDDNGIWACGNYSEDGL